MKNQMSKLSLVLIGFIGGIAFLISCGGGGSEGTSVSLPGLPINEADAGALPVINDQMYCTGNPYYMLDETNDSTVSTVSGLSCIKQSTKVQQKYNSLAGVYAEGWVMVEIETAQYLFYK